MEKLRLLIASPYSHFLSEVVPALSGEFEIQRVNSEEVLNFLCKEWNPQFVVIDGDSVLFNACDRVRNRQTFEQMAILMVTKEMTALREEKAFRSGADQVISYPMNKETFYLRLKTLARRLGADGAAGAPKIRSEPIAFGEILVFPEDHIIKRGDQIVTITPIQFKLLMMFLQNRNQLLSRQKIKDTVWEKAEISLRSIDAQISKLRKIVHELDPHLVNIYGKGYVFTESRGQAA